MAGSPESSFLHKYLRTAACLGIRVPETAIETGTYRGDGTLILAQHFSRVYTIELSRRWHDFSRRRLSGHENVTCLCGDSAEEMRALLPNVREPVLFFLDAHFAGGETARGMEEVPLLRELAEINRRSQSDIIIMDDLRLMGTSGECGSRLDPRYPPMHFDWTDVTLDRIILALGNQQRACWIQENDRIVVYRNLNAMQAAMVRPTLWCVSRLGRSAPAQVDSGG